MIAQQADELDVREGKVLTKQGDIGHEFFVIEEGTADVEQDGKRIAQMGPGDFFGELALLAEDRRTATVTATSPMTVIVLTRADFRALDRIPERARGRLGRDRVAQRPGRDGRVARRGRAAGGQAPVRAGCRRSPSRIRPPWTPSPGSRRAPRRACAAASGPSREACAGRSGSRRACTSAP